MLVTALLLLGLPLSGCDKPIRGDQTPVSPTEEASPSEKSIGEEKVPRQAKKIEIRPDDKKTASLKDCLEKYRFKWADEKDSDFPLMIEIEEVAVPEEILGPFPENAEWRTEKKTEKKPSKGILPKK
jgi:hypothetical protein